MDIRLDDHSGPEIRTLLEKIRADILVLEQETEGLLDEELRGAGA